MYIGRPEPKVLVYSTGAACAFPQTFLCDDDDDDDDDDDYYYYY